MKRKHRSLICPYCGSKKKHETTINDVIYNRPVLQCDGCGAIIFDLLEDAKS
jgi:transcription elongation factor Elf1